MSSVCHITFLNKKVNGDQTRWVLFLLRETKTLFFHGWIKQDQTYFLRNQTYIFKAILKNPNVNGQPILKMNFVFTFPVHHFPAMHCSVYIFVTAQASKRTNGFHHDNQILSSQFLNSFLLSWVSDWYRWFPLIVYQWLACVSWSVSHKIHLRFQKGTQNHSQNYHFSVFH